MFSHMKLLPLFMHPPLFLSFSGDIRFDILHCFHMLTIFILQYVVFRIARPLPTSLIFVYVNNGHVITVQQVFIMLLQIQKCLIYARICQHLEILELKKYFFEFLGHEMLHQTPVKCFQHMLKKKKIRISLPNHVMWETIYMNVLNSNHLPKQNFHLFMDIFSYILIHLFVHTNQNMNIKSFLSPYFLYFVLVFVKPNHKEAIHKYFQYLDADVNMGKSNTSGGLIMKINHFIKQSKNIH